MLECVELNLLSVLIQKYLIKFYVNDLLSNANNMFVYLMF